MRKSLVLALFLCVLLSLQAQRKNAFERPRIVVNMAIDGLRSDIIALLWDQLDPKGLKRLISEGSYCKNITYPYWSVGDVSDYASVYTGTIPSDHGLCCRSYWNPDKRTEFSSLYDRDSKGVDTKVAISPKNILTSTFTDELRLNTQGKSKIISIGINPEEAVVMAGHGANACLWIDDRTGKWVTSSYYGNRLPSWAVRINMYNPADRYVNGTWKNLFLNSTRYKSTSAKRRSSSALFSYKLSGSRRHPYEKFKNSPYVNSMVAEMALSAIKDEYIGMDANPDVLNLQFTLKSFDQATTGVVTSEIEDMYYRLDKEIKMIIESLEKSCGHENVLYVLFSTQTEYANPEFLSSFNVPAGYFVVDRSLSLVNTFLMANYGQGDFIHSYRDRQLYINKIELKNHNIDYDEFEEKLANFMARFQGIQYAFRAKDLESLSTYDYRVQMIKNAYNRNQSGDIMMFLQPGWVAVQDEDEKVGLSTRINNYAPLIISGWNVKQQTINKPVSVIDIASTISNMLHIAYPNFNMGNPILDIVK